ncbi:phage tail spike protein [Streptococcus peroris]|uniref:phage tail spike protein n=1 Tax=Streptococcus peroris TaxID=68891 RepID=UPI0039C450B9
MIYLFDKNENLIKLVKKDAIKSALQKFTLTTEKYVSDRLTVEMKDLTAQELEQVEYMAIQSIEDAHKFHFFYIAQKISNQTLTLVGVQSGIEELRKSVVLDKRPNNSFARPVIDELLAGTNWQARFVSETSQRSTNFYYISTFEALKKVCQVWNLEMQFFVEMNGNKIGARYIDFKQKIGEATGKRVVYGHNALQILQEVERTNLFTALIGRGKGEEVSAPANEGGHAGYGRRVTFEDIVWEKAKGAPVDKPRGQKYVELPEMTKKYGIKNADGTMRAKIGFAVFQEEEDANALIRRTYEQLVNAARPQLTLKTSTVYLKNVSIGDTIRVVRHDKKLDYDTRIFEITFNRLNNESSDIKLGDRISESNEAKIQNIASQKADELISTSFNSLIKNLPDFLPSADGMNKNWYGANDPTKAHAGKVAINDIWFKPNPEHEGQTIMLRWTGEVWEEIIRSDSKQEIIDEVNRQFGNLNNSAVDEAKAKAEEALRKAGASSALAEEAKYIADQNTVIFAGLADKVNKQDDKLTSAVTDLKRYSREETQSQIAAVREIIANGFVAKSTYLENVEGINQRFEALRRDSEVKLADYKQGVDGRFTSLSSQIAGKVSQTDFQRVKETSQLYERILGGAENDVSNNVSRMVMSSEIFQTEVGKYSTQGGPNLLRNSRADDGLKYWNGAPDKFHFREHEFYMNGQKRMFLLDSGAVVGSPWFIFKRNADYTLNLTAFDANTARVRITLRKYKKDVNQEVVQTIFDKTGTPAFDSTKAVKKSFKFNTGDFDKGYLVFEYTGNPNGWSGMFMTELDFYEGANDRKWQPAPEDSAEPIEAVRTQMTLLSNSWSVKALNGPGDVLGAINLNPDGSVKINEGLISVGEKTYIKDGVIKSSMIGNTQIGTAHIGEIDASQARIINISAKNIVTEGLTANIIKGGKLSSLNNITDFDLQTGWIDMNGFGVGIKNRFPNRPLQYLVFGAGNINGVDASYTALLSNRNGIQQIDHTSAGIQIWNGRTGDKVQSAINMYGQKITFNQSAQEGLREIAIDTNTNSVYGIDEIYIQNVRLSYILNDIYDNFRNLGAVPGNYSRGYYTNWH